MKVGDNMQRYDGMLQDIHPRPVTTYRAQRRYSAKVAYRISSQASHRINRAKTAHVALDTVRLYKGRKVGW